MTASHGPLDLEAAFLLVKKKLVLSDGTARRWLESLLREHPNMTMDELLAKIRSARIRREMEDLARRVEEMESETPHDDYSLGY